MDKNFSQDGGEGEIIIYKKQLKEAQPPTKKIECYFSLNRKIIIYIRTEICPKNFQ